MKNCPPQARACGAVAAIAHRSVLSAGLNADLQTARDQPYLPAKASCVRASLICRASAGTPKTAPNTTAVESRSLR